MIVPALVEILAEHPPTVRMAELLKGNGFTSGDVQTELSGVLPDPELTDLVNTLRDMERGLKAVRRQDTDFSYTIKTLKDRYRKWRAGQVVSATLKQAGHGFQHQPQRPPG